MKKRPDHRYQDVVSDLLKSSSPDPTVEDLEERRLYDCLSNSPKKEIPETTRRAHDIFSNVYKKEVIEAFLLAKASAQEIEEVLQVPSAVTELYRYLFFDTDVFEDNLDRINYAHTYDRSEYGAELKKYAVDVGKECLKIRLSSGGYSVSSPQVQDGIRSVAFMMAQLVRVNPLDSSIAKEALRWASVGLKAAADSPEAEEDPVSNILVALKTNELASDAEKCGISQDDIIH